MQFDFMHDAIALVFGYLCGSIPFGLLLTRATGGPDIRTIGSGNIGATNVLRTGNKVLAAATLLADMLKGAVPVMAADMLFGRDAAIAAALGAFFGHLFPVWIGFKGGKGVATYIGLLIGFKFWMALASFCLLWAAIAGVLRYSSLAALVASTTVPAILWINGDIPAAVLFTVLTATVFIKHRANIFRLIDGTESQIGEKSV